LILESRSLDIIYLIVFYVNYMHGQNTFFIHQNTWKQDKSIKKLNKPNILNKTRGILCRTGHRLPIVLFTSTFPIITMSHYMGQSPVLYNHHPSLIYIYTINFSCFNNSLFLAPFLAGDIKYLRIGGGFARGGGNIF